MSFLVRFVEVPIVRKTFYSPHSASTSIDMIHLFLQHCLSMLLAAIQSAFLKVASVHSSPETRHIAPPGSCSRQYKEVRVRNVRTDSRQTEQSKHPRLNQKQTAEARARAKRTTKATCGDKCRRSG